MMTIVRCEVRHSSGIALVALGAAILLAVPAQAIQCDQGYQRVNGNLIATPYCQDGYLAQVAAEFGMKVSADKIRNNPSYKREVCRLAGQDIRVQTTCDNDAPRGRSGRF